MVNGIEKETRRIEVAFTENQYELIAKAKGESHLSDSEFVKNIVLAWLIDRFDIPPGSP